MTQSVTIDELVERLMTGPHRARQVVALAGPPGAGKTTTAARLEDRINGIAPGLAATLPMDGYHYDDLVLVPRGLRPRKGAPETFDVAGFAHMLLRLRSDDEDEIAVPVFDRDIEIARAGARIVPKSARIIITEGNYLLLDREPWRSLSFDATVMIAPDRDILRQRLVDRWTHYKLTPEEMVAKIDGNDMPNVDLVLSQSRPADYTIRT
ncbi:nucleoside triphosphate hydrolase [Mesorhizobium sp. BR1-1-16]|uniref:nucleoside triphosphate hydrolase n=1 Tax=Mesorhizobium sp. BR1-1-16 TaxID=2876653 RepID=UPI001CCF3272|nr:nucleoside triphosphate hydrolase [Mesorhizobium sp. BR1-1-16]MBZ9935991.1 nucleoside triphosphate hydrolase [Mesorhizobium sp. BR1-1-16]